MTRTHAHGRRRGLPPALVACIILAVAGLGGALLLHSAGAISIPFLEADAAPAKPAFDRTGRVPVPISVRPIEAYSRVGREHVLNPRTMQIATVWMRPEEIPEDAAQSARDVLGRVLRHDKQAGQIFMKDEFYPRGTRPGPTAGIPPGKRAMRLKTSDVPGLHGLQQGDHFDIVMTLGVEVEEAPRARTAGQQGRLDVKGPYAPLHAAQLVPEPNDKPQVKRPRAEVHVVVQNGVVIKPVHQRQEIGEKSSLLQGTSLTKKPVEELIIAVEPKEVAQLNQALALEATLQVAMRSGRVEAREGDADEGSIPDIVIDVDGPEAETAEGEKPKDGSYRLVEVIVGGEKRLMAIPREKQKQP